MTEVNKQTFQRTFARRYKAAKKRCEKSLLARKLDISPWYIACEPEPTTPLPPLPQTRGTPKAASVSKSSKSTDSLPHTSAKNTINIPDVLHVARFQQEMRAEMREMCSELQAIHAAIREIEKLLVVKQSGPSATSHKS